MALEEETIFSDEDTVYMRRALILAKRGKGLVNPNPMVGAVVVRSGRIIGEGFHRRAGEAHAEIKALEQAGEGARGATMYVTLEPCNHFGRTPPCTEAIIQAGVSKVIFARKDVNPLVKGGGAERLRKAGIIVQEGLLEKESAELNRSYERYVVSGRPFISIKVAITADGKIATAKGLSRWISGSESRRYVHKLRRQSDAVLVGIGTVLQDNPLLTVREVPLGRAKPPWRVVLDSHLRIPPDSRILSPDAQTMIFTTRKHNSGKARELRERGAEVITVRSRKGMVDIEAVVRELGERGCVDLLVEGGATVNRSFIESSLADYYYIFIAPKIFGGISTPSWVGGRGVNRPDDYFALRWERAVRIGDDYLLEAYAERKGSCSRD